VAALAPGLGAARRDDLKVAVTEACSNAIDAHRAAWGDGPVYVRCNMLEDAVAVEIVDQGAGFDPDEVAALPAATDPRRLRHESGLGIPLMRTLADDVAFIPVPGGTHCPTGRSPGRRWGDATGAALLGAAPVSARASG
jgi:anti-sigma regulatory factor (Ser/Thr protein kinase)